MVTTFEEFEKSKEFFNSGDIANSLDTFDKALDQLDRSKASRKKEIFQFLEKTLNYCKENNLKNEEAVVLRLFGRTHTKFKEHAEALKYSYLALKIRKKLGKKLDIAESLVFLAEDLEVSGNYEECIENFSEAANIFHELGKLKKEKAVRKELTRLESFSKQMVEDEYIMQKFHVDNY